MRIPRIRSLSLAAHTLLFFLAFTIACLFWRSYHLHGLWSHRTPGGTIFIFQSNDGRLILEWIEVGPTPALPVATSLAGTPNLAGTWFFSSPPGHWDWANQYRNVGSHIDFLSAVWVSGSRPAPFLNGFGSFIGPVIVYPAHALAIPLWFLELLTILPITLILAKKLRRHRRIQSNHCPNCNYDLRASPERCPECGRATIPTTPPHETRTQTISRSESSHPRVS